MQFDPLTQNPQVQQQPNTYTEQPSVTNTQERHIDILNKLSL